MHGQASLGMSMWCMPMQCAPAAHFDTAYAYVMHIHDIHANTVHSRFYFRFNNDTITAAIAPKLIFQGLKSVRQLNY